MDLALVFDRLGPSLGDHLSQVAIAPPLKERGKHIKILSELFQAYAICYLLLDADTQQFREYLTRSGCASRYFRQRASTEGLIDSRHLALSRSDAFFDSLVAGRLGLARDIALLSEPIEWRGQWEYEDDHYYHRFLQSLLLRHNESQLRRHLAEIERVIDGAQSPRLDVAVALLEQDPNKFDEGLVSLLDEKRERDDQRRPACGEWDALFWPQSYVSIEGLALLQLAALVGIVADDSYAFCPDEARLIAIDDEFDDVFGDIARLLGEAT